MSQRRPGALRCGSAVLGPPRPWIGPRSLALLTPAQHAAALVGAVNVLPWSWLHGAACHPSWGTVWLTSATTNDHGPWYWLSYQRTCWLRAMACWMTWPL